MTRRIVPDGDGTVPAPRSLGRRPGQACSGNDDRLSDARATILVNGTELGLRRNINLVQSGSVTLSGVDYPDTDTVDVTIDATGGSGPSDHGALTGLGDDDHAQYALADGTRGSFEPIGSVGIHEAQANPHAQYQLASEKGAASGYAALDASSKLPIASIPTGSSSTTVCIGDDARLSNRRVADGIYETSGPTDMPIGAIADGEYLRRSGSSIVGGTPTGGSGDDTVGSGVSATDIAITATYADIVSDTLTLAAGDQVDIQIVGVILNNSGAVRTYRWQFNIGAATVEIIDGATVATNATNRAWFKLNVTCAVVSSSSSSQTMDLWRTGPVATSTSSSSATTSLRSVWRFDTSSNLTGTVNLTVKGRADATAGTQNMRVLQYKVIKTPTR
jgi:hypothetical protein